MYVIFLSILDETDACARTPIFLLTVYYMDV